jgi:hypothetical protein
MGHHISISISSSPASPPQPLLPAPALGGAAAFFFSFGGSGCFMTSELPACWRIVAHGLARKAGWARICGVLSASACLWRKDVAGRGQHDQSCLGSLSVMPRQLKTHTALLRALALIGLPLPSPILPSSAAAVASAFLLAALRAFRLVPSYSSSHSSSTGPPAAPVATAGVAGAAVKAAVRAESDPPVSSVLALRFARRADDDESE